MESKEVDVVARHYNLHPRLVARALRNLQTEWIRRGAPANAKVANRRAAAWLRAGEETGQFAKWRKEAPLEMAGRGPQ